MNSFLVGLQFLTRIRIVRQTVWTAEDFGRSTRFFPLVGLVLGICYALAAWILVSVLGMRVLTAALLLILPLLLTALWIRRMACSRGANASASLRL